jgi:pimeloyl-ACP methyl ester carboxylesterase
MSGETFVLVHGAYHGAWCWYRLRPELESRGHEVVTFDLPAHGIDTTPYSEASLDGYVDRVCEALDEADGPPVLVGHSMAGMLITAAAERVPSMVDTLVYLTAYLPGDGESMLDQRSEASLVTQHFEVDEERGVGWVPDEWLDEAFYADCGPEDRTLARSLVRPEPIDPISTPVTATDERFGSVRRVYVGCTEDRAITREQQEAMLEERGVDLERTLEASHSPFLSVPGATADALETAAVRE